MSPVFAPAVWAAKTITLGYVSPQTGPLAAFAEADNFIISNFLKTVKGGLKIGGTSYPVEVKVKDSQSSASRAADVANELINGGVDIMLVASTPETTNPVSTQCEVNEVPCISSVAPWQPYFIGRQQNPRRSAIAGSRSTTPTTSSGGWRTSSPSSPICGASSKPTNRSAACSPMTATAMPGATSMSASRRCSTSSATSSPIPGRYQNLSDNFTSQISAFKEAKCDIITGVMIPPDFTTFWNQALQQGFKPKIASVGKALLFPVAVEALGKNGNNLSSEVWWTPSHPFKSSLTGQSAKQLADGYQAATKKQWTQPIGFVHALFEVATDVLKRTGKTRRRQGTVAAIQATKLDTIVGHIAWSGQKLPPFALEEHRQDAAGRRPMAAAQERRKYDIVIVDNKTEPKIPTGGKMEPIA